VDRRRSREDRELVARSRPFARFQTAEAHETLVSGLLLSRRLRKHIELLAHYRRLGLRTLEEARDFEIARRKKEQEMKVKRSKQGADGLLGASAAMSQGGDVGSKSAASGTRRGRAALPEEEASVDAAPARRQVAKEPEKSGEHGSKYPNSSSSIAIRDAPDGDLLSVAEADLCGSLGLAPQQYLAIQAVVVRYVDGAAHFWLF
jgi:transcriptional adapter 2-alpha